ncbi:MULTISPECIES: hypothetical protein [Sutcliffiella]|uniref:Transporter n=1 Tax=Sutcliffiella cohnii TaxID=33932 RepID=A0A223KKE0_9BACI|nr:MULTISPECIES: hypothetical protein [Sutcliffiella]AST89828.1 hypothetical protein BC6307_00330 [Sutcliffiella cohnii]MED4018182.1 hypothetical protein [Sutcliffiella cohnii]WBL15453.1 hypothetical protein O1A01_02025 [Sutcliffiella sp. NC1]
MKKSFQIGSAFVGLIVGAGFASGQEVMQYFTSFGIWGTVGGIIATILFAFLGYTLAQLGSQLQTQSHKDVIYHIGGRYFGFIFDIVITFFLFGVAVVMFAASGSTFEQMFGIHPMIGSIIMVAATILTLLLNIKKIINIIAVATPYLMIIVFTIVIYSIFTMDLTLQESNALAQEQTAAASNWIVGSILYVSYNIACGAALLIVMGGTEKDRKVAGMGGLLGGIMLGVLIILIHIALLVKVDVVGGVAMPTLELASQIHPFVGVLMAIALLGLMYNTAVGMFYSFTVRLIKPNHKKFKSAIVLTGLVGFFASFVGFTTLVGKVYSTVGYIGIAFIVAIIIAWARKGKKENAYTA